MTTYDFHAQFAFALQDSIVQGQAIQWLAGEAEQLPERWQAIQALTDPIERLTILAQAMLGTHSDRARSGTRQQSGGYRFWVERHASHFLRERREWMQALGLEPNLPDLAFFPAASWALEIPFALRKPYLSKDDTTFHLLDNPVRKEQIFQVPMVAATGWKGALRAALWQLSYREDHEVTIRLLGNPRESEAGQAGRLHFFATFFEKIGLEVINPHNRQSGVGERGPILMECVPQGATGTLLLLYVPFGSLDRREVAQDLAVTAQGLHAMLTTYGFGAKTSSGFGVVEEQLIGQGKLLIRAALHTHTFTTLSGLQEQAQQVAAQLRSGGGG
jgi:CRISPR-associated protein Cmr2